jgi:hypothetical protein
MIIPDGYLLLRDLNSFLVSEVAKIALNHSKTGTLLVSTLSPHIISS